MLNHASRTALALAAIAASLSAATTTDDRTLEEFVEYVAGRMPNLSEAQLDAVAKRVDENGDGKISDEEFGQRMAAIRHVMSAGVDEEAGGPEPSDYLDGEPVVLPPLTRPERASVLLITADELAEAWSPFAEWKTRCGKPTRIITVRQIAREYDGQGIQEKIRRCVREHIETQRTSWVILGGDCTPGCNGLVPGGHTTVHAQEPDGIPTDIVYLSATDWDADGDGIYGEWEDDREAISYPNGSVGLGRVPVRTAADVAAFTDKVIAYESRYPNDEFATQMLYTCTDSPAYPKVRRSWDQYVSKAWPAGSVERFFNNETPWDDEDEPGSYALSADHLVELINDATKGKLHLHGHGVLAQWILEGSRFTAKHVDQLENEGAYPLITTVSCNTGEYDSEKDPSIVESMIRKPKGGSVAIVAPIRTGKAHLHDPADFELMVREGKLDGTTLTMTRYWEYGCERGITTGQAFARALKDLAGDARKTADFHLCACELNLLGDPTLSFRAQAPRTVKLAVPPAVPVGSRTIEVVTDTPGAQVCLWKGLELYSVSLTGDDGRVSIEVETKTPGEILVTLTGVGLNTVSSRIEVE